MSRRVIGFACGNDTLVGTLDLAALSGRTGLLIVSGGNEIRAGSWAGQAQLAARLAEAGVPVFRFDRRGVGDSEGSNAGWRGSRDDIAAAITAFRAAVPDVTQVVALGNCDAASALMQFAADLPIDGLVLSNPWTLDADQENANPGEALSPAALRQHYFNRLAHPHNLWRLVSGKVNLVGLFRGLRLATKSQLASPQGALLHDALGKFRGPVSILIAAGDRTARQFLADWPADDNRVQRQGGSSHSFAGNAAANWLYERLLEATASRH